MELIHSWVSDGFGLVFMKEMEATVMILIKIKLISGSYSKPRGKAACLWLFPYSSHEPMIRISVTAMSPPACCQHLEEQFKIPSKLNKKQTDDWMLLSSFPCFSITEKWATRTTRKGTFWTFSETPIRQNTFSPHYFTKTRQTKTSTMLRNTI